MMGRERNAHKKKRLFPKLGWSSARLAASGEKGAVLVEAVVVIPILLMIFVGLVEFSQAFTARRRVQSVASTTADLVSQAVSVAQSDLNDIASAGGQLMLPFASTGLTLTLMSVGADANSNITVNWSCSWTSVTSSGTCSTTGAPYTSLPSGLISANQCIIIAQTAYTYTPILADFLANGVQFASSAYFFPRQVTCVSLTS